MVTTPVDRFPAVRILAPVCMTLILSVPLAAVAAVPLFSSTTLVSDQSGASVQDPGLLNAWGVSYSPTSPFWVSSNGAGTSTLYTVNPATDVTAKVGLTVTIQGAGSVTGQVFNGTSTAFNGDNFLFVSEDGTVSGWRGALGTAAETLVTASADAIYKGTAIASTGGHSYLYAANFKSGAIDVFKGDAGAPSLSGTFVDPNLPSGYGAFNIQQLSGQLVVSYAKQDPSSPDEVAGAGLGIVDAFDLNGGFLRRIVSNGGDLNAPWGLALAPGAWGDLAGKLLVGNFGDGLINAYDFTTGASAGQLKDALNNPLAIDGLWALTPGNGGSAGSASRIYFTAGPNDEANGAFGVIQPIPVPAALPLLASALMSLVPLRRLKSGLKSGPESG